MARKQRNGRSRVSFFSLISGSLLSSSMFIRRLPIVGFLCLLMIFYIGLGFMVQKRQNELDKLSNEIIRLRTISVTASALRQQMARQSNIEILLSESGIEMSVNPVPPRIISVSGE